MSAQSITTPTLNRDELERAERRARHFWVSLIVGLLGLQVAGGITAIFLSVGDPSMAIVPNYHQAALNWDVTHRAHQLTQQLGWKIDPTIGVRDEASGARQLPSESWTSRGSRYQACTSGQAFIITHVVLRLRNCDFLKSKLDFMQRTHTSIVMGCGKFRCRLKGTMERQLRLTN